jgi:hypothetical protein
VDEFTWLSKGPPPPFSRKKHRRPGGPSNIQPLGKFRRDSDPIVIRTKFFRAQPIDLSQCDRDRSDQAFNAQRLTPSSPTPCRLGVAPWLAVAPRPSRGFYYQINFGRRGHLRGSDVDKAHGGTGAGDC